MTVQQGSRITARAPYQEAAEPRRMARGKFSPPRFPADLVGIERWRARLDAIASHEVCIVKAPAGYGKTAFSATLFAEAQRAGWRAGWVSFDPEDNESAAVGHIFEAVRLARGGAAEGDIAAPSALPAPPAILAGALVEEIAADDHPLLLILDDVDCLTDLRATEFLNNLLRHPPAALRLVFVGRDLPAIGLADAEGRGMVLRIGTDDLGLADEDVLEFVAAAGSPLDARDCTRLNRLLRGWPAGLRIATRHHDLMEKRDWNGLAVQFAPYLAPLFEDRHPDARRFLMHSSVAPQLNDELVRLLGEEECGVAILEDLHRQGLFVDRSNDGRDWYRVHPSVGAVYRQYLNDWEPARAPELHRVTARYYEAQGMIADAIDQFLAAGTKEDAARLMSDHALSFLGRGEIERLAAWFDALSDARIASSIPLLRVSAWLGVLLADRDAGAAIASLKASGEGAEACAVELLHTVHARDLPDGVVEEGDRLLAGLDALSDFAKDMVRTALANGAQYRGLFGLVHDVVRPLRLRPAGSNADLVQALATRARAAAARSQGQLAEAERVLRDARPGLAPCGLPGALVDASLARCHYERDDLAGAGALAASALSRLERTRFQDAILQAFQINIRVAAAMARTDDAATLIDRAELIAFDRNWAPLKAMCIVERARLRLPPTIDAEAIVAAADEAAAVRDPLSASARAFALLAEMRAYEAIANGDRPRLTGVAEHLLCLASNADDAELRASATLFNILPQLSGRCDKMVELETVRFLNHAASVGFRRTIVDVLDVTGVRAVQNFCSEAYSSGSFLALLKLAEPSRREPALESGYKAAPGEAFSFLTEREIEILSALHAGESNKEIARTLQLAPETVKWHLKNVMRKLRATSREEAVANAATLGLKLPEPHAGAVPGTAP